MDSVQDIQTCFRKKLLRNLCEGSIAHFFLKWVSKSAFADITWKLIEKNGVNILFLITENCLNVRVKKPTQHFLTALALIHNYKLIPISA